MSDDLSTDAVTNNVMMAVTRELDKVGVTINHRHYDSNRRVIQGLVAMMIAKQKDHDDVSAA